MNFMSGIQNVKQSGYYIICQNQQNITRYKYEHQRIKSHMIHPTSFLDNILLDLVQNEI